MGVAERSPRQARYLAGLLCHVGAFLVINTFFWSLAFHARAYLMVGRQP